MHVAAIHRICLVPATNCPLTSQQQGLLAITLSICGAGVREEVSNAWLSTSLLVQFKSKMK